MDLVIRLNLDDGPTTERIRAAVGELKDRIDDQFLEDLIYAPAVGEVCGIPFTVMADD